MTTTHFVVLLVTDSRNFFDGNVCVEIFCKLISPALQIFYLLVYSMYDQIFGPSLPLIFFGQFFFSRVLYDFRQTLWRLNCCVVRCNRTGFGDIGVGFCNTTALFFNRFRHVMNFFFFLNTSLRYDRVKTMFCEINWWNWVRIILSPIRSKNLVELGEKIYYFVSLTHSGRVGAYSGPGVVGGSVPSRDATDAQVAFFGRQNESPVSWLSNEPKIEP